MQEIRNNTSATLNIYTLILVLAVLVLSGCGAKVTSDEKDPGNNATTPSPTEETVIRGRA